MNIMEDKKNRHLIKNGITENWELPALTDYDGTITYKEFARKIMEEGMKKSITLTNLYRVR